MNIDHESIQVCLALCNSSAPENMGELILRIQTITLSVKCGFLFFFAMNGRALI